MSEKRIVAAILVCYGVNAISAYGQTIGVRFGALANSSGKQSKGRDKTFNEKNESRVARPGDQANSPFIAAPALGWKRAGGYKNTPTRTPRSTRCLEWTYRWRAAQAGAHRYAPETSLRKDSRHGNGDRDDSAPFAADGETSSNSVARPGRCAWARVSRYVRATSPSTQWGRGTRTESSGGVYK